MAPGFFGDFLCTVSGPFHDVAQHGHVREEMEVLEDHADLGPQGADRLGVQVRMAFLGA